jgi:hypothetical protein
VVVDDYDDDDDEDIIIKPSMLLKKEISRVFQLPCCFFSSAGQRNYACKLGEDVHAVN